MHSALSLPLLSETGQPWALHLLRFLCLSAFLNFYRTAIFSKRGVDVTLRRDGMTAPAAKIFTLTAKIFTLGLEKPKPNPVSVTTV